MQAYAYIEILLLDNFLITLVIFLFSASVLKVKVNKHLMIFSAFISAIINLGIPFLKLSGLLNILFKVSFGFVLCFICCFNKEIKEGMKFYITFMFSTCLFGGVYFFAYYSLFVPLNIEQIPIGFFALIVLLLGKLVFRCVNKYFNPYVSDLSYICEIFINDKKMKINAFLDTGNLLKDETGVRPVAIIQLKTLKEILTKKEVQDLIKQDFAMLKLREIHLIEYKTIEGKPKNLIVFMPDKFIVNSKNGKKEVKCLLGVSLLPLFKNHNFQAIISADIARGV